MARIRKEIQFNITSFAVNDTTYRVLLDTAKYPNATYYFEVGFGSFLTPGESATISLRRFGTTTDDASITTVLDRSIYNRVQFTPPAGATEYAPFSSSTSTQLGSVSSKIVIVQDEVNSFSGTETQIPIASNLNSAITTPTAPTYPFYFNFNSANYDGTLTVYLEALMRAGSSTTNATMTLQVDDGTFNNWTNVTNGTANVSGTTISRVRSSAITLVNGRNYRVAFNHSSTMSNAFAANGTLIIQQSGSITKTQSLYFLSRNDAVQGRKLPNKWFVSDWSNVTNLIYNVVDAVSTGVTGNFYILEQGGSNISGSLITNPSNQSMSSAFSVLSTDFILDSTFISNTGYYDTKLLVNSVVVGLPTLSVPTLSITNASATSIDMSWTSVTNATNYVIDRSTTSDFASFTQVYSGASLSFSDTTGLTAGQLYYYRIKAQASGYSDSAYDTKSATAGTATLVNTGNFLTFFL